MGASGSNFIRKTDEEAKKKEVTISDVMVQVTRHEST